MPFKQLNTLAKDRIPFLFVVDYKAKNIDVIRLDELKENDIEFSIDEFYTFKEHPHSFDVKVIEFKEYKKKFDKVIQKIKSGDTYLLNLTQESEIDTLLDLKEIYRLANAHYKLRYKDKFVCFSPEKFIQIKDDKISTFPMKGTIDASTPNAKDKLLNDEKEMAEHIMIVDLLRNDLSIVSSNVKVVKFRYITEIEAGDKKLLQVSSHISGDLDKEWHSRLGDILEKLLPAGSISGTPKRSTLDIIDDIEGYERGYFSGVFGVYDGESLDSGVMIRFIEKKEDKYVYKSGGGITLDSDARLEYKELQEKIYLP